MTSPKTILSSLLVTLGVLSILNISLGSVYIPFSEIVDIILGNTTNSSEIILFSYRLPKTITAICVGSGLSVAGLLMQSMFRNALAGPFILGISNGASLGVAILMMFPSFVGLGILSHFNLVLASIVGATLIFSLVLSISMLVKDNLSLLIVGMMVGSVTGAIVSVLQYFSQAEIIQSYLVWTFGSLAGLSIDDVLILSSVVSLSLAGSIYLSKSLNAILLGEMYAKGVGVNVMTTKRLIMIITCLLAGVITAFCGPIAFVGLAVPHLARLVCKTSNHSVLLPTTILMGACLLLVCDTIAQLPSLPQVLPINAVTALFGAPVVIWVILRNRSNNRINS